MNSSLAQPAGELCLIAESAHGYLFWELNLYPICVFWALILTPDMLASLSNPA